jgi:hypothetical protein
MVKEEYKGFTIKIEQDEDGENPREWDNLGTMICFHGCYNLGDKHDLRQDQFNSWRELHDYLVKKEKAAIILPIYMMDHSGLSVSVGSDIFRAVDSMGWDWGQIGFIYMTKDCIRKEMARPKPLKPGAINPDLQEIKHVTKKDLICAEKCLRGEVETLNQYLTGDVYGFIIEDADSEHIDSCWGFYGYDDCLQEAKSVVDCHVRKAA